MYSFKEFRRIGTYPRSIKLNCIKKNQRREEKTLMLGHIKSKDTHTYKTHDLANYFHIILTH